MRHPICAKAHCNRGSLLCMACHVCAYVCACMHGCVCVCACVCMSDSKHTLMHAVSTCRRSRRRLLSSSSSSSCFCRLLKCSSCLRCCFSARFNSASRSCDSRRISLSSRAHTHASCIMWVSAWACRQQALCSSILAGWCAVLQGRHLAQQGPGLVLVHLDVRKKANAMRTLGHTCACAHMSIYTHLLRSLEVLCAVLCANLALISAAPPWSSSLASWTSLSSSSAYVCVKDGFHQHVSMVCAFNGIQLIHLGLPLLQYMSVSKAACTAGQHTMYTEAQAQQKLCLAITFAGARRYTAQVGKHRLCLYTLAPQHSSGLGQVCCKETVLLYCLHM